ncbi:MAG: DUF1566 domain-containing protein, partial [Bacteroidetes bacterium]|nr:DUF1566 domain-containing protein [Bacteroidota bacterium]
GLRNFNGDFNDMAFSGCWWSSSVSSASDAWYRALGYITSGFNLYNLGRTSGFSVRCLKNTLPQVNTTSVTNVTPSTALVTGEVISEGDQNTTRGFCYSTTSNPTVSSDTTMNGTGLGVYSGTLQNLTPLTSYYVRAYATNSLGTSYGNEVSFTTSLSIGSNYAGGIVFYLDSTGQHGLVCASSDSGTYWWGCHNVLIGTSVNFGAGNSNTNLILSGCGQRPIAASVCDDLVLNGYSDWYLPSKNELQLMYSNLHQNGLGNFSWGHYWTSSEETPTTAWAMIIHWGAWDNPTKLNHVSHRVRAIRSF